MPKNDVRVDLFYSGAWTDITATRDVYTRDPITITRGRPDKSSRIPPSTCNLTIENRDGKYSPRLPTSALYGLIGRNTPVRVSMRKVLDTFTRTVSAGSWGSAESGQVWGSANSVWSVTGGRGRATHAGGGDVHNVLGNTSGLVDSLAKVKIHIGQKLTGTGAMFPRLLLRYVDVNNFYQFGLFYNSSAGATGDVGVVMSKNVAGVITNFFANFTFDVYDGSEDFWLLAQVVGATIRIKVWRTTASEPAAWTATATDIALGVGSVVIASSKDAGVTNTNPFVEFDDLDVRDIRFSGEVESFPQRWNVKGSDVWAPITANGIMRRLNAPGTVRPEHSAPRRYLAGLAGSTPPVAAWSLEEGQLAGGSTALYGASDLQPFTGTHPSGAIVSFPRWGRGDLGPWLPPVVSRTGSSGLSILAAPVSMPAFTTTWTVDLMYASGTDAGHDTVDGIAATVDVNPSYLPGGATGWPQLIFVPDVQQIQVAMNGEAETTTVVSGLYDGLGHHIRWTVSQSGGNVTWTVYIDGVSVQTDTTAGAMTLTAIKSIGLPAAGQGGAQLAQGYVAIWTTPPTLADAATAALGHIGETAAARLTRLCAEEGVPFSVVGDATSERLGPQRAIPFLENLFEAADADGGILYEPRHELGLAYRTHRSLYNNGFAAIYSYAAGGEVAPPLAPVEDTDAIGNDIIVTRLNGTSTRAVQETGTLNVAEPPAGVGRYAKEYILVLFADAQTFQQAYWKRHLGTWDEARFPIINLDLAAMAAANKTTLIAATESLDVGARFAIGSLPAWLPPDVIDLRVQGFTETIGSHLWSIAVNATPALPYQVGVLNHTLVGRLDSALTTLNEALDTTETGVDIITTGAAWSTADEPYDVMVGGELMRVSACTGAGPTQTFTVTRSFNGVVKTHAIGAPVRLSPPLRLAR